MNQRKVLIAVIVVGAVIIVGGLLWSTDQVPPVIQDFGRPPVPPGNAPIDDIPGEILASTRQFSVSPSPPTDDMAVKWRNEYEASPYASNSGQLAIGPVTRNNGKVTFLVFTANHTVTLPLKATNYAEFARQTDAVEDPRYVRLHFEIGLSELLDGNGDAKAVTANLLERHIKRAIFER